ncbi:NAD(P)H-dependent oxidoreductase [Sporolactobacillus terrae]|uniref:NAD(P)H-dependent oxidoreductase n=1 Tax=Sporolactobacillus terrae TaxID=269673 RepID=A0ABX5Q4E1_9BACL|nr:NAD(P)H-dependent oxidoreductase [Sporolactobacillus terrae]QAA21499.1 NAD(P)H-dependent oxidoreductase [Sporolactobacillus terrae]QAA24471.1 NAD(P)H-dependent oxidoreductase [Sporolactobacillus terrae]UAK16298.1 NAD(P)H-dependent oxidoreductase [Sporolactobacillus terrae]
METTRNKAQIKAQILSAFHFRHACKAFDSTKKISDDDFRFILETARLSPSSFGLEPWKFVVVQTKDLREKLAPEAWGATEKLKTASHFVLVLSRLKSGLAANAPHVQHMIREVQQCPPDIAKMMTGAIDNFQKVDFDLASNDRVFFEWGCRQCYLALANMMTAAAEIGIDSCPIEGFNKEKVEKVLKDEGIIKGGDFGIACMAAFGYRAKAPRPKTRQPIEDIVDWR